MSGTIKLNETEETFLSLLDEFARTYVAPDAEKGSSQTVECRIAGGWVRDKVSVHMTRLTVASVPSFV